MQVRPLLFVVYVNCVFVAYWIYDQTTPYPSFDWLSTWFICIALGGEQNYCAESITLKHINSFPGFTITGVRFLLLFPFTTSLAHSLRSPVAADPYREHGAVALSLRD